MCIDSDAVLVLLGTCGVILRVIFCGFYANERAVIMWTRIRERGHLNILESYMTEIMTLKLYRVKTWSLMMLLMGVKTLVMILLLAVVAHDILLIYWVTLGLRLCYVMLLCT